MVFQVPPGDAPAFGAKGDFWGQEGVCVGGEGQSAQWALTAGGGWGWAGAPGSPQGSWLSSALCTEGLSPPGSSCDVERV